MLKVIVIGAVVASAWGGHGSVRAQVPSELREKLLAGEVVTRGAHVFAMATGNQRGTREGSEELLVARAMGSIANKLCAFEAKPGLRLESSFQGGTLVYSEIRGNEISVVIKVPLQKPSCRVVEVVQPLPVVPLPPESARTEITQTRQAQPSEPQTKDIVIRKFDGEY